MGISQLAERLLTVRSTKLPGGYAPLDQDAVGVLRVDGRAPAVVDLRHVMAMGQPSLLVGLDLLQIFRAAEK